MTVANLRKHLDLARFDEALELVNLDSETNSEKLSIISYCFEGKGDYDKAHKFAKKAIETADNPLEIFASNTAMMNILYRQGNYNKMKKYSKRIKDYLIPKYLCEDDFAYWEAKYTHLLGSINHTKGAFDKAHDHYIRSFELNFVLNNRSALSYNYLNIGELYLDQNNFDEALSNFYESMQLGISQDNYEITAYSLYNIGIIKYKMGEFQRAMEYYKQSINYFQKIGKDTGVILNHNKIGSLYIIRGLYNDAKYHFLQSIDLSRKLKTPVYIAISYSNMAKVYQREHNYTKAIDYLTKSLSIWSEIGNLLEIGKSLYLLIQAYQQISDTEKVEKYLDEFKEIVNESEDKMLTQKYKFLNATYLKNKARLRYKVQAQEIFEELLNTDLVEYELKVRTLLNLIELKIFELSSFDSLDLKDKNIIEEINPFLEEIEEIAEKQKLYTLNIELNILRSRLALIDYDYKKATDLLERAEIMAEQIDDNFLLGKVQKITKEYFDELEKWKLLAEKNVTLREKIEQSKITDYLKDVEKIIKEN